MRIPKELVMAQKKPPNPEGKGGKEGGVSFAPFFLSDLNKLSPVFLNHASSSGDLLVAHAVSFLDFFGKRGTKVSVPIPKPTTIGVGGGVGGFFVLGLPFPDDNNRPENSVVVGVKEGLDAGFGQVNHDIPLREKSSNPIVKYTLIQMECLYKMFV